MKFSKTLIAQLTFFGPFLGIAGASQRAGLDYNLRGKEGKAAVEIEAWERILSKGSISMPYKPTAPKPSPPSPPTPLDCCDLPSGEREKQLLELYSTVSSKKDIETKDSPQNKAFNWILNKDEYCVCPSDKGCEPIQRYVMAVYYYSTKGEDWANCGASSATCNPSGVTNKGSNTSACYSGADQRWLSKDPSCKWCGNNCDDPLYPDCITQINLDNINQGGTLPQELKNITYLYFFSNEDGTISGTIPPQLGLLKNLSFFDINFQDVQGTIPDAFYKLDNLTTLDLNDNKMTGTISSDICNLKDLFFFQAGNDDDGSNNFGGSTLPSCIGSIPTLAVFDVSNSNLKGNIPPFNNPNLSFLDVGDNDFTGSLTGPNWSNLKNLETLVLSGNPIDGTIPTTIGEIKTLQLADFTDMSLTGTMPAEICANRNTNGGNLEFLQSDCEGVTPKVTCTCCTFCN